MPIYEYRCLDCDHEFELMQKFSDPPVGECPTCSGAVQKLISRSAFHLKGDGWYVTDYARKSSQNGKGNMKNSSEASDSKTSTDAQTPSESKASTDTKASSGSSPSSESYKTSGTGATASPQTSSD